MWLKRGGRRGRLSCSVKRERRKYYKYNTNESSDNLQPAYSELDYSQWDWFPAFLVDREAGS
jgi:hypothetical protein